MFRLTLEKPVTEEAPIGFRTDLSFGDDAEAIHSTGLGAGTDTFDLTQAYVATQIPFGDGIDLQFGKFVTLLGGEVIESKDNWNFSRSSSPSRCAWATMFINSMKSCCPSPAPR